ncbi:MAG: cupredoxin family copper-binding protein [Sedimenticolaceae bacterium]|jgi:plastocyanin
MKKSHIALTALVFAGALVVAPTFASHVAPGGMKPIGPPGYAGCGGMPPWGKQRPVPPPYGYQRPMYGPAFGMPYYPPMRQPMRGQMPDYAAAAQPMSAALPASNTAAEASSQAAESAQIAIRQMQFTPARVVVKKGATVTWTQGEAMPHKVTANNGGFGSDALTKGETYAQKFDEAGTFGYYCGLHPSMRGEIVVVD